MPDLRNVVLERDSLSDLGVAHITGVGRARLRGAIGGKFTKIHRNNLAHSMKALRERIEEGVAHLATGTRDKNGTGLGALRAHRL